MRSLIEFIDRGLPLDIPWSRGLNALHLASSYGHLDMIKYLINECRMDITTKDDDGWTALHHASTGGYIDVVMYLIHNYNAHIDQQANDGSTALLCAVQSDKIEMVKYLIDDVQAYLTITTKNCENIFDFAYRSKYRTDIVVMLLQRLTQEPKRGLKTTM
jgi:ankyrin repeat protein